MARFQARRCSVDACGLRFPVTEASPLGAECPHCGAPTHWVDDVYESHEAKSPALRIRCAHVEALFDNVRSLSNVGSMFRTADGAGIRHLHLGGITPSPLHPRLAKTGLGAEREVPWTQHKDSVAAARHLRAAGHTLWAIEAGPGSQELFGGEVKTDAPITIVMGHEVSGIDPAILELCHTISRLPMLGVKGSLNVSVAFGIAAYWLRFWP